MRQGDLGAEFVDNTGISIGNDKNRWLSLIKLSQSTQ